MLKLLSFLDSDPPAIVGISKAVELLDDAGVRWTLLAKVVETEQKVICSIMAPTRDRMLAGYVARKYGWEGFRFGSSVQTDDDTWEYVGAFPRYADRLTLRLEWSGIQESVTVVEARVAASRYHGWGDEQAMREAEMSVWLVDLICAVTRLLVGDEPAGAGPARNAFWFREFCRGAVEMLKSYSGALGT